MKSRPWWKEAVFYQVYPRSFYDTNGDGVGDLQGITEKLDYLQWLGITAVWLSPVYASSMDDNGYDISDYRAINPEFGSMADFDRMLEEMHRRDIRLVMDLVVNHTSDEHPWFLESRKSKDNPYRDYYIWHPGREGQAPNNWEAYFKGPAWELDPATGEYYLHLFSRKQPDLNWRNPAVRREVYDLMNGWLRKGIDGFRMDVINFLAKAPGFPDAPPRGDQDRGRKLIHGGRLYANQPGMHEYLQEMHREVLSKYDGVSIGECHYLPAHAAMDYVDPARGELDLVFQFETMYSGGDTAKLKNAVGTWYEALKGGGWNTVSLGNHDSPRQIHVFGNETDYREASARLLALLLMTSPGTPFFLQGDELGMTNVDFPSIDDYRDISIINSFRELVAGGVPAVEALARLKPKGRDNARTPVQWSAAPHAGFSTGTPWIGVNPNYREINVAAQRDDPDSVLNFYRGLIAFRKKNPALCHGDYAELDGGRDTVYGYRRSLDGQTFTVVLNFSSEPAVCALTKSGELVMGSCPHGFEHGTLRPWEGVLLRA